jgi:dynein heavy chain
MESVKEANLILEETLKEVSKLKKDHIVEVKALTKPPMGCVVILGGLVILCTDMMKKKGGSIIMRNIEGSMGKKEEDWFATAKRFVIDNPNEIKEYMINEFDKEHIP